MKKLIPVFIFVLLTLIFFKSFVIQGKIPIPSDTIVGLYHPYRDFYANAYPRGIPFKNFLITDPIRQQYPWKNLAINLEKKIQLPLWNPYTFAGSPLLANFQSAVFYPLNIIFFFLPFYLAWGIFIMLQPFLAMLFLYLYLNNLKLNKKASLFGSIAFAFGGFSLAWLEWGNIIHSALWLPLILLSIDKILISFKNNPKTISSNLFKWSFVFIFSLVSSFFAGHLQIFFYVAIFSVIYGLSKLYKTDYKIKKIPTLAFLGGIFVIITFVQWLPTLNFILLSARDLDQNWITTAGWFIPWQNAIQVLIPDFFGNPSTLNYWGVWNYSEFISYLGIATLIFATIAVFRRDRKTLFFIGMLIISFLFAFPTVFAKIPFKLAIPFISSSQPTRLVFIIDFCLSILAALGLDYFIKEYKKKGIYSVLILFSVIFALLWIFIIKFAGNIPMENLQVTRQNLILPTILFIFNASVLLLIFFTKAKNLKIRNVLYLFIFLILLIDLFRFGWKYTPFVDGKYLYPNTKTLKYLSNNLGNFRIMTTDAGILPSNLSLMYKFQTLDGYDPLYLRRNVELMAAIGRSKPDINSPFGFNRIVTFQNYSLDFANLFGVKYVLSLTDIDNPKLKLVSIEGLTKIYENLNVMDRAFFIGRTVIAKDKQMAIDLLFDVNYPLRNRAIIEDTVDKKLSGVWNLGFSKITKYEENRVEISTDNKGEGFLILTDSYYPTWHAAVDGIETKIYLTDYNFRGIIIPKGKHQVVFYQTLF